MHPFCIVIALKVIGGSQMNIKIETKPSFKVAGVLKESLLFILLIDFAYVIISIKYPKWEKL